MGDNVLQLAVGMMFRNKDGFKQHMALYAIENKFCFRSPKSDQSLVILVCQGTGCPWRVYAARLKDCEVFEIRKVCSYHCCSINDRAGYQNQATACVVGELMKTKFVGTGGGPKPREIRRMMRGDHNVNISYWKAWRSRDLAVDNGQGTCNASYVQLPYYLNELVTANPGTVADLHTESNDQGGERFKYMFVAMGACVRGYQFMRKVVVVDGTHLKGKYAGCLLTASAQDGNYQIYPLAFAIVDSENDMSWEWFFKKLSTFVTNEPSLVVVSDRHPSIFKGVSKVFPSAGHCVCVVHLKRNIRSNFKGSHLGYLVAKAARAYRLQDFYKTFNEIKLMDPACAAYLVDLGFHHWARSHFDGNRYNIMTSNLAESWNSVLLEAREFPIIPLVDFIRGKLMSWFATRRDAANKNSDILTPRVLRIVTRNFELTGGYEVKEIAEKEYEVRNKMGSSFHVNIGTLSCSCFEFQMLSIPCSHAISAALRANVEVDTLVTEAYKVAFLRRAYEGSIAPVTDYTTLSDLPTAFSSLRLSPPATRRPPGRPKKLRYFSRGEKLVKSFRRRIACSRCKALGHNKATCKNAI
ncbi:uncharacterized protein LOC125582897 [Brassica napus]|uniref:uncharacterized protein LOC125582897 n=1 Tax=Brassica napus TaxID=3708 RepID=UPI002078D644|nr:uncharacterized protein LOC125582897 [Brassica napus]